jgi:hypothetical protein
MAKHPAWTCQQGGYDSVSEAAVDASGATNYPSVQAVGAGLVTVNGKFTAVTGLGVGNSVAATTPGTVVKKVEIFNAAGASLGFIPVYDAIT